MSTNYPRLSMGLPDAAVRHAGGIRAAPPLQRLRTRTPVGEEDGAPVVTSVAPITPQTHGDRLLADTHLSKCAFLRVVHRFVQEYSRQREADLYIRVCCYRVPAAPRSVFDSAARADLLHPHMEWCALHLTHQTDLEDARVHLVLRPHAPEAIVTLPHVARPPSDTVACEQQYAPSSTLQVGHLEFALCEPLTLGVSIVCNGAAVDRSMRPGHLHDLPHRAVAAHRAGKSAGLFFHALAQEPLHEWHSPDDVCMPTEYLSKTSEGVHVVLYNAGRGEREHSLTRQMLPTIAVALRDVHLSMDELFSTSEPPRWPMALAFMQLCKLKNSPSMVDRAKAVLEAYRAARNIQHEMEDTLLCSEFVSDDTYGIPAYRQLQEYQVGGGGGAARGFDALDSAPMDHSRGHTHPRRAHPSHSRQYSPHNATKPQCAIC